MQRRTLAELMLLRGALVRLFASPFNAFLNDCAALNYESSFSNRDVPPSRPQHANWKKARVRRSISRTSVIRIERERERRLNWPQEKSLTREIERERCNSRERHLRRSPLRHIIKHPTDGVCYMQMDKFIQSRQGQRARIPSGRWKLSINKLLLHGRTALGKLHNTHAHSILRISAYMYVAECGDGNVQK
jgi:hypothetical protein